MMCLLAAGLVAEGQQFKPAVPYTVGETPFAEKVGDFNHDGNPDIAVANYDTGGATIM